MSNNQRFLEIDFLRGIGIIMVVVFHLFFDFDFFGILPNEMYEGFWLIFQRSAASLLILVFGISLVLRYEKLKGKETNIFSKFVERSLFLAGVALLITIATWIYPHNGFIIFGIIHFFALSVILGYFFQRFYYLNLALGLAIVLIGLQFSELTVDTNLLFWLGLSFKGFYTLDYFPLFPWFGIVLIGIFIGKKVYINSKNTKVESQKSWITSIVAYLGRNSLFIYIAHQPILIGILNIYLTSRT